MKREDAELISAAIEAVEEERLFWAEQPKSEDNLPPAWIERLAKAIEGAMAFPDDEKKN